MSYARAAWAERVAAAVEEGTLYVSSAEWAELVAAAPPPGPGQEVELTAVPRIGDLPVAIDDAKATARRRAAEDIARSDLARLGPSPRP